MRGVHRYLPWAVLSTSAALGASLWGSGFGVEAQGSPLAIRSDAEGQTGSSQAHHVAPWQLVESNMMVDSVVNGLEAVANDGRRLGWAQISGGRPVVLVFIKNGCPCSVEFEPFFHRVAQLYEGAVRFAGVIDADVDAARRYASEQHVPYPVLADADRTIIRRFRAKNGCYVSVLTESGVIDSQWPGSSADALQDLGRRISKLAGTEERALDVNGMPKALTTGCHFGL